MSEANDLEKSVNSLEDLALQKRFAALFDEGQGDNARRAFVSYCSSRGYHPSEMKLLCGANLFDRMDQMLRRQSKLISEQRETNIWLLAKATALNGGKAMLPPKAVNLSAARKFGDLVRQKFGPTRSIRGAILERLGVSQAQFSRLSKGENVSEVVLDALSVLPDFVEAKRKRGVGEPRAELKQINKRVTHLPKPQKFDRVRSDMSLAEFEAIAKSWFGEDWIVPMATFIDYNVDHIKMLVAGDKGRHLTKGVGDYLRVIQRELTAHNETFFAQLKAESNTT